MGKIASEELLIFAEDTTTPDVSPTNDFWHILIVDDDAEIHTITRLALADVVVSGRSLQFHSAYNAEQAIALLSDRDDIAMILLDVVMERDDAGLRIAAAIRHELNNHEVRIVLRTGQPGTAPEERVIRDYDINDYRTKTELTRARLLTTVYTAIRSYQQIRTINASRIGLRQVIASAANLMERHSMANFAEGVVTQIASLLGLPADGMLGVRSGGGHEPEVIVLGAAGRFARAINRPLTQLDDDDIKSAIFNCIARREHLYLADATVFYIKGNRFQIAAYLETKQEISDINRDLINVFLANISIGFENAKLFEDLRTTAYLDRLTGLANRVEFIRMLGEKRQHTQGQLAVIIDINHFSDINDGLGADIGNEVLVAVARRLQERIHDGVFLARVGADVFGLIGQQSLLSADFLFDIFRQPFAVSEHSILLNIHIGMSSTLAAEEAMELFKYCFIALRHAKRHASIRCQTFCPQMETETQQRLELIRRLRADFHADKLTIWYQPQICLKSGKVIGVEALLRWPQDDGSFISPAVFIPLAEYSGLIVEIGEWVLKQACEEIRRFDQAGLGNLRVAINVSVPQIRQWDFAERLQQVLTTHHIPAERLELEITESIVMDEPEHAAEILKALKQSGIRIAIDDFGVGFSSLSYLQSLPIDRLKIDRSFVKNANRQNGKVIIETIVEMGHKLGLSILAEGVEEAWQVAYFQQLKCAEVQGYYFARPLPAEQLMKFIHNRQSSTH
ncbi:EAL domain-containing protein [Idiomarina xiamenensis]|uniref:Signal protein n=1 Tax=Idiomarina xiamenensis 10-D-4 TaxID=740709 RepID=K2KLG3_9GAMM|nr:EAL domain-containing protein [Idiomarina xiamenensis]EKE87437.1 signal protein [Idiomarina xiamenensis 10-D-4]